MNLSTLSAELTNDPLSRSYAGMTDQEAANSLNAVDREVDVNTVPGRYVWEAVVPAEYNALTSDQKTTLWGIINMGDVYVKGSNTRLALGSMFSPGDTRDALIALQIEDMSRARELGLGFIFAGHIQNARAT